jgi:hypothetical protein
MRPLKKPVNTLCLIFLLTSCNASKKIKIDWFDYETGERPKIRVEGFEGYSVKASRKELYFKKQIKFKGLRGLMSSAQGDYSDLGGEGYDLNKDYQSYVNQLLGERLKGVARASATADSDIKDNELDEDFYFLKTTLDNDIMVSDMKYNPVYINLSQEPSKAESAVTK